MGKKSIATVVPCCLQLPSCGALRFVNLTKLFDLTGHATKLLTKLFDLSGHATKLLNAPSTLSLIVMHVGRAPSI
jgi:ABC-type uncharacterized transport system permease subunit